MRVTEQAIQTLSDELVRVGYGLSRMDLACISKGPGMYLGPPQRVLARLACAVAGVTVTSMAVPWTTGQLFGAASSRSPRAASSGTAGPTRS